MGGALLRAVTESSNIAPWKYSHAYIVSLVSYTANPLAYAAEKSSRDIGENKILPARGIGGRMSSIRHDKHFANICRTGTVTALDLTTADAGYPAEGGRNSKHSRTETCCSNRSAIRCI